MDRRLHVALFIPCYVDQFYPQVGIATLQLLEKHGCKVSFPDKQTCCGQPMANSGYEHLTKGCNENFVDSFAGFDYIVCPSGSCTLHIKEHLKSEKEVEKAKNIRSKIYELTEFLVDILNVTEIKSDFPYRVGLHNSCHGQRGLGLSSMSEINGPVFSKPKQLLQMVNGLELVELSRKDECCGFGGTFCVSEEAISVKMGKDRVNDHIKNNAEVITGVDMSCLMHLEGILKRQNANLKVMHLAEILNGTTVTKQ